ncbi:MAG: Dabb family protein [Planctomycetes bacterium]|nr:Dabb family protein [Planctomycetota bacterium]
MVTHMVLFRVRPDVPASTLTRVMGEIGALQGRIPGILDYSWGAYSSPEGLNRGYTHGFCMRFRDAAARDAYLPHPEHERVKEAVLAILDGGVDGVLAFDYGG